jgi:hypothetical protein
MLLYFNSPLSLSHDELAHLSHVEDHASAVEGSLHQVSQLKRTHIPSIKKQPAFSQRIVEILL